MHKIVVASDSFKGSLSSMEVAQSATKGIRQVYPDCEVVSVNVADGGEGTVDAVVDVLNGQKITVSVSDPLGRKIDAVYGIAGDMAIIEMSAASGLPLLMPDERNPLITSTYGTGELILDALKRGCRRFLVGIGGSATNDAGTGMLEALGFKFYDAEGMLIENCCGGVLERIAKIDDSNVVEGVKQSQFIVACDVDTPFCGKIGAAYIFAPQKGADADMVRRLDEGMTSFAHVIEKKYGMNIVPVCGAGAAGGMGGAFYAFLNGKLKRGIDMVLDAIDFDSIIKGADLIITGEGKVDSQTVKGKTAAGVFARAQKAGIPVIAIGGKVEMCDELSCMGFAGIYPITTEKLPLEVAMRSDVASANVTNTIANVLSSMR